MRRLTDNKLDTLYEQVSRRIWDKFPEFFKSGFSYWWHTPCCLWPAADDIEEEL